MKQPMQNNLALNFLFKDQDLSKIITMKEKNEVGDHRQTQVLSSGYKINQSE